MKSCLNLFIPCPNKTDSIKKLLPMYLDQLQNILLI